jgi:hypothetical protein
MAVVFARRDVIVLRPCVMYEVCRCKWKVGPHACQRVTEISSYGQNPTLSNTGGRQMGLIWAGADWSVHLNRVPHDGPWSAGGVPTIGKVRGRRSFVFANRPRQPPKLSVPFTQPAVRRDMHPAQRIGEERHLVCAVRHESYPCTPVAAETLWCRP